MLFNLGMHEALLLLTVTVVLVGLPFLTWFLARRKAKKQ